MSRQRTMFETGVANGGRPYHSTLFQDDVLATQEFRDRVLGEPKLTPFQRLALALIEGAWYDLHLEHFAKRHRGFESRCPHCDARAWVAGDDSTLTFERACDLLNIDASWLRRAMEKEPTRTRQPRSVYTS